MFSALRAKAQRIKEIDINAIFQDVIVNPELGLEELNRTQLSEGLLADGSPTGDYAPMSVKLRDAAGLQTDHIDLSFEGDFYASFHVKDQGEGVIIMGDSVKPSGDLADRFPNALGLTDESKAQVRPVIAAMMLNAIKEKL